MDLCRVWDGFQLFARICKHPGDEVSGSFVAHPEHHGGPDIKSVALALEVTGAPPRNDVPASQESATGSQCIAACQAYKHSAERDDCSRRL